MYPLADPVPSSISFAFHGTLQNNVQINLCKYLTLIQAERMSTQFAHTYPHFLTNFCA